MSTTQSKKQARVRHETEIRAVALGCVFSSESLQDLANALERAVLTHPHWRRLAGYRKERIDAYLQGSLDTLTKIYGRPLFTRPGLPKVRVVRPAFSSVAEYLQH